MSSIIDDILESLHPLVNSYGLWTVILTSDPKQVRSEFGPLGAWYQWDAKHVSVANLIKEYLCARGMRTTCRKEMMATHVCIFKASHPYMDDLFEEQDQPQLVSHG